MPWYIRKIKPGEEEAFVRFLSAWVTDVPVTDRYRWLYERNPHGKAEIWLAVDKKTEEIAACTAIFPKRLRVDGGLVLGCVGGDTYVDPRWRRNGIAAALHRTTATEMKNVGIELHYGFPLPDNFQAKLKAGALHPGYFFTASLPLSIRPILRKARVASFFPKGIQATLDSFMVRTRGLLPSAADKDRYTVRPVLAFNGDFETLEKDVTPSFPICCVRDLPYLQWRFFENPMKHYAVLGLRDMDGRLQGYAAIERVGEAVVIGDLFVSPSEERVNPLLRAVVEAAVIHGAKSVVTMVNPEEPLGGIVIRFGFRLLRENRFPMIVLTERTDHGVKDIGNWHITAADLDV